METLQGLGQTGVVAGAGVVMAESWHGVARDSHGGSSDKSESTARRVAVWMEPPPQVMAMLDTASPRRLAIRASRPALNDLRFKGDACVVPDDSADAAVCLGDYRLTRLSLTPLDVPAMNRAFLQVRYGQARREIHRPRPASA
jgi:hypothetical protein